MTEDAAELILVLMVIASALLYRFAMPRLRRPSVPARTSPDLEKVILVGMMFCTMAVIPFLDMMVPWFEFADIVFMDEVAWLGLLLGSAAVWLFWRAKEDLARCSRRPVVSGIYRYLRHPACAAMLLWSLAQLLLLQNWLAGPAAALTFTMVYLLQLPREEQRMLERYGHRYLDYMARTPAILPRFSRYR